MKKRITALLLSAAILLSSIAPPFTAYAEELTPTEQPQQVEQQNEEPSVELTEPAVEPTVEPTAEPTVEPTAEPTAKPTAEPTVEPTAEPTAKPTAEPTQEALFTQDISDDTELLEELNIPDTENLYVGCLDFREMDADFSADGIEWDFETNTLTLTDVTIVSHGDDVLELPEKTVIVSKGTANYLISDDYGIYADGELTITGGTPLYLYSPEWGFDVYERLIIDGTPFTAETDYAHSIYYYRDGQSLDSALVLKNGSYIKTTSCFPVYCDDCWYFMTEDREYADWDDMEPYFAKKIEFAVTDQPVFWLEKHLEADYAGKANDAAMAVTLDSTAKTANTTDPVTYQWYKCDDYAGTNPVAIDGATSATYTFAGSQPEGSYYFYCQAKLGTDVKTSSVTRVDVNATGRAVMNETLFVASYTATVDKLATYGYKWDKATSTLTFDNFVSEYEVYVYCPATIVLAEGSTNSLRFIETEGNVTITGDGALIASSTNFTNYINSGVLTVAGGADVIFHRDDRYALYIATGAKVNVTGAGSRITATTNSTSHGAVNTGATDIKDVVTNGAKITTPADAAVISNYIGGASTKTVVIEANTDPFIDFTSYPQQYTTAEFGDTFTLTATAQAFNMSPAPEISYKWYDVTGNVVGTAATLTVPTTETYANRFYCVATATYDGNEYTATGTQFVAAVLPEGREICSDHMDFSTEYSSESKSEGYSYDASNNTLTLNNCVLAKAGVYRRLSLPDNATIYLPAGTKSVLYLDNGGYTVLKDVTIMGGGTLEIVTDESYGVDADTSGRTLKVYDSTLIITNIRTSSTTYCISNDYTVYPVNSQIILKAAKPNNDMAYIGELKGCEVTTGKLSGKALSGVKDPVTNWTTAVISKSATPSGYIAFSKVPDSKYIVDWTNLPVIEAEAITNTEKAVTYKWYDAQTNAELCTGSTYSKPLSEKGGVFKIYCKATSGSLSATSAVTTLIVPAKTVNILKNQYFTLAQENITGFEEYGIKYVYDSANKKGTLTLTDVYLDTSNSGAAFAENLGSGHTLEVVVKGTNFVNATQRCFYTQTNGVKVVFTGGGTVYFMGKSDGWPCYDAEYADVEINGGTQVNTMFSNNRNRDSNSMVIKDKGSEFTIYDCYGSNFFLKEYSESDCAVRIPEAGYIAKSNAAYAVFDAYGNRYTGELKIVANFKPVIEFTSLPNEAYEIAKGAKVNLSVKATVTNNNSITPTYEWYNITDPANKVKLATGASYTFTGKTPGTYKFICRATAVNEGIKTIKETPVITISVDAITTPINLSGATKDEQGLGWSWDNDTKTLTLKGLTLNVTGNTSAISLPADSTILVEKGTTNTIASKGNYSIYCNGALEITGSGKLVINSDNTNTVVRSSSGGMDIKYADITVNFAKDTGALAFSSNSVVDLLASYIKINYPTYNSSRYNRFRLTDAVMTFGTNTSSSNYYYVAENTETGSGQIKIEPTNLYFGDGLKEINVVEIGKTAAFTADAVSKSGKKLTYTWYKVDRYNEPDVNPVKVGTAQTLKVTPTKRGISYYYCDVSDGTDTLRSRIFAVVTPTKGAKARTSAIEYGNASTSVDMLATEGWAWNKENQTLTLSGIDMLVPFERSKRVVVDKGVTVVLEGTNYLDYEDAFGGSPYIVFYNNTGDDSYTFTGGGTLYCAYTDDGRVNGYELIIKNGVKFITDNLQYDQGSITVDGAQLIADSVYVRNYNDYRLTLKNGARVEIADDINIYTPLTIGAGCTFLAKYDIFTNNDVTIEEGALLGLGGQLHMGLSGGKEDRVLTVRGTLSAADNFVIYSTAATPVVIAGTSAVTYPAGAELVNYGTTGYRFQLDGEYITGKLVISDENYTAIKMTAIGAINGKPNADTVLTPGALTPAGATVVYTWQWAETKDGHWKDIEISDKYQLETMYHDKYIRVKAIAYGAYDGEVYSAPMGPVVGNPTSLIGLHGVGLDNTNYAFGGTLFDGDYLTYTNHSRICDDGTYRYIAVPANEKAVVTIRNLTTGFESVGTAADVEMAMGTNDIEIEVAYGGETRVYKITHFVSIPEYNIFLYSDIEGVTITAKWKDADGNEQTETNTYGDGYKYFAVPRGTEVTVTSTAPYGKRVAAYYSDAWADVTKEGSPYTFIATSSRYIEVYNHHMAAIAPQNLRADWLADEDHINITVDALKIPDSDPVAYYDAIVNVYDEDGRCIVSFDSEDGDLVLNGDVYEAVADTNEYYGIPLTSDQQYTVEAYYPDLYNTTSYDYIIAAQQEAVVTVEPRREIKIDVSSDYIVIKSEDEWNNINKPAVEILYNGYYGATGFELIISDTDIISDGMTGIFVDGDRTYLRIVPVNPAKDGTAYITIKAKDHIVDGEMSYVYKTIRVDVNRQATTPTLNLGTTNGTLNLYDSSAITVPVYGMDCGYEVESAVFKESAVSELFEIEVVNGRTLRVTPKIPADTDDMDWAAWAKALNGKTFKSQITVNYNGISSRSSTETLSIKVTNKTPSVKVSALKFNSFFTNHTLPLTYTVKGETVAYAKVDQVKTTAKTAACPAWLTLASDGMSASIDATQMTNGKAGGKLALKVWLEGWRVPVQVSVTVSAAKTTPKLKLAKTTITVPATYEATDDITLGLVSSDKKVALTDMCISNIKVADSTYLASLSAKDRKAYAASVDFYRNDFNLEEGTVELRLDRTPKAGKILLLVYFDGAAEPLQLPVTVKTSAKPVLKTSASKLTFYNAYGDYNSTYYDGQYVYITSNVDGLKIDSTNLTWTITRTDTKTEVNDAFIINVWSDGKVLIARNETVAGKTYKIDFKVDGVDKPVTVNATVVAEPTLTLSKTSGTLNRAKDAYGETIQLTYATKEKLPVKIYSGDVVITGPDGVSKSASDCTDLYIWASSDIVEIECGHTAQKGKYKIEFYGSYNGLGAKPAVFNLTVTDKVPTIKATPSTLTLNKNVKADKAFVAITAPEGYYVYSPYSVTIKRGTTEANNELYWNNSEGGLVFETNSNTKPGTTYTVTARYHLAYDIYKDVKFTVKVATDTAPVKVTGSVKNTLDLARPDITSAVVTYKYTGWNPAQYDPYDDNTPVLEWKVYAMNGKVPVTTAAGALNDDGLVASGNSAGTFVANSWFKNTAYTTQTPYSLALMIDKTSDAWNNGDIWPTYKYVVKTTVTFPALAAPNDVVTVKDINFTVKQGKTKFAADVKSILLSRLDGYNRQYITITNTDKDTADVAKIAEVQFASSTRADALQIRHMYTVRGKSVYAVSWKDNQVPATFTKGTVKLNIFLEGNDPARNKPNATVSLTVDAK